MFFRTLAEQPPQYLRPLIIVLVAGTFSAIAEYLVISWIFSFFSAGFSGMGPEYSLVSSLFGAMIVLVSAFAVFGPFVVAILAGLVFYILAGFVSKGGSLAHAITAVAWGTIPLAIFGALQIPLFLAFRSAMDVTISPEFFAMIKNSTSASSMDKEAMMHMFTFSQPYYTYTMLNASLHVLAWLCCAWFWIPAVRNTCAVDRRQAALIVLVPLFLYLAATYGPALITGGHVV